MAGTLYVVATPIGNLGDLTERARATLAAVDVIAAEDTRRTGRLLSHLGIRRPLRSYYDAVEASRAPALVAELAAGRSVALVSDAGTPGIADPGYRLVRAAIAAGVPVVPVPGPSALTAFLPVSGLPTDRFAFEGFLPARAAERRRRLAALAGEPRTLVFLETGPRLAASLADLAAAFGSRPAAIGRELTKLHEEIVRDDLPALAARAEALVAKGEIVIGVAGAPAPTCDRIDPDDRALADEIRRRRAAGTSVRDVADGLARERGFNRRVVYRLVLSLERDEGER
ncbi:MAG: 16S rRNA (cytidine(1402)-2'-O)-methyltransferase [Deltaproteobacteria bacterium]|nr:16S rRNA (cytidine(1402)-2'-O)-methyltransferase [Deltaproteobacteria bacterium]